MVLEQNLTPQIEKENQSFQIDKKSPDKTSEKKKEVPVNYKKLGIIIAVLIIITGLFFGGFWIYNYYSNLNKEISETPSETKIKIDQSIIDDLNKRIHYGQSISPYEGGYGRQNPFAPY